MDEADTVAVSSIRKAVEVLDRYAAERDAAIAFGRDLRVVKARLNASGGQGKMPVVSSEALRLLDQACIAQERLATERGNEATMASIIAADILGMDYGTMRKFLEGGK